MSTKWDAKDYAKQSSAQFKWAKELIDRISLTGQESILDIGCGDGKITALLSQKCKKMVGIDASKEMIQEASAQYRTYENLSLYQKDASKLNFQNEFDLIFSNATLHWIKDHTPVLKGVYESLKPGGKFFFSFAGKGNAKDFDPIIKQMFNDKKWSIYFKQLNTKWQFLSARRFKRQFLSARRFKKLLIKAGLRPSRVTLVPKDMVHENRSGLEGWVRTTWHPYMNLVPEQLKNDFVTELVSRYIEKHPVDEKGQTHVKMVRLEAEGTK